MEFERRSEGKKSKRWVKEGGSRLDFKPQKEEGGRYRCSST